ncbi:MAG: family 3 glycosyl hydrolase [Actinobacteria bacterium]|nr:family 3 glycosyl hydrolase [Actinomycetota bacterium]
MATADSAYMQALSRVREGADHHEEARGLIAQMTVEERLHCLDGGAPVAGGLADMSRGGYHRRPFRACRVERLGIPGFHFSDGPRGVVVGPATAFPVTMARGASFDVELEERIGDAIGVELRAVGADLYGGVCVNILRHPAWGRAQEVYGEDPHHMGVMGAALASGAQRHVMATVKHFALNSMENARFSVDVTCDERTLHEIYLPHFKHIVDEGIACVMSAYNSVNGSWCGENAELLTDILREQWGFDGFVISDWIFGLRDGVKSVRNGLDVEMPYRMIRHAPIVVALESGELSMEVIDAAVERTLATMLRFNIGDRPISDASVLVSDAHRELAREAAQKSMVLLQNSAVNGVAVLPLIASALESVAVVGRLSDMRNLGDGGSSDVMAPQVVTPLAGIRGALPNVDVLHADGSDVSYAARLAEGADVAVVVVGYTKEDEGEFIGTFEDSQDLAKLFPKDPQPELETAYAAYIAEVDHELPDVMREKSRDVTFAVGGDRTSLRLRDDDVALIRAVAEHQPRTIVVIVAGSAVVMEEWRHDVPAILMSWYSGMEGGYALADVLLGVVNPSGRLPFVVPKSEDHLPFFDATAREITYDYWHGQWKLDRDGNAASFPFGFGLSYTTYSVHDARVQREGDNISICAQVSNTGAIAGASVVQVYASLPGGVVERAQRKLVGFARCVVAAGDTTTIDIDVPVRTLAVRDVKTHDWWLEPGEWVFDIAQYSGDPTGVEARVTMTEERFNR